MFVIHVEFLIHIKQSPDPYHKRNESCENEITGGDYQNESNQDSYAFVYFARVQMPQSRKEKGQNQTESYAFRFDSINGSVIITRIVSMIRAVVIS